MKLSSLHSRSCKLGDPGYDCTSKWPPLPFHCELRGGGGRFVCLFTALLPVLRTSNTWHLVVANKHLLTAGRTSQDSRRVPSGRDLAFEGLGEGGGRGLSP